MKTSISILIGLFLSGMIWAQQPEKVYSVVKERKELSWYQLQLKLWKAEIDKDITNADAWYNYYSANRALQNLSRGDKEKYDSYFEKGSKIVEDALKEIPETFEAQHMAWWHGGNKGEFKKHLFKAYEMRPTDERVIIDLLTHYEIIQDQEKYSDFAKQYFKTNSMAPGLLNWAYNLLAELDENAIVLTAGDNDTYGPWIVQEEKSFRKDVRVLNTSLLLKDEYRKKVFEKLGIEQVSMNMSDVKSDADYDSLQQEIFTNLFKNKKNRPVYVAVTAVHSFQDKWGDKLFLTGLAYKYCEGEFDNLALIQRNYEKRYLKDHLNERFYFHQSEKIEDQFNATYLPAFVKLYKHYRESEEVIRLRQLKERIIFISERSGQQSEIAELLGAEETASKDHFQFELLDVKDLEKNFVGVKPNLKISKTEATNQEYRLFLNNLYRSRKMELLEMCRPDSTAWSSTFKKGHVEPMEEMYHYHVAYNEYPVVNVSYESVLKYCDWLTEQYNSQRKRKYNKVLFRLPTEEEWRQAAGSGDRKAETCFEGDNIKNAKECWLANIREGDRFFDDGGFFMVKTDSYIPNDLGLYCALGNVSEMIAEKGKAKGGSWFSEFDEAKFSKTQTYNGPNPTTGFRLVMEVISE